MLATLGDLFSSKVVSMLVKSTCMRSSRVVAMIGCRGALDKLPSCCKPVCTGPDGLLHLTGHSWPPKVLRGTEYSHSPDVLHLYGICSEQQFDVPLEL